MTNTQTTTNTTINMFKIDYYLNGFVYGTKELGKNESVVKTEEGKLNILDSGNGEFIGEYEGEIFAYNDLSERDKMIFDILQKYENCEINENKKNKAIEKIKINDFNNGKNTLYNSSAEYYKELKILKELDDEINEDELKNDEIEEILEANFDELLNLLNKDCYLFIFKNGDYYIENYNYKENNEENENFIIIQNKTDENGEFYYEFAQIDENDDDVEQNLKENYTNNSDDTDQIRNLVYNFLTK